MSLKNSIVYYQANAFMKSGFAYPNRVSMIQMNEYDIRNKKNCI